ncbi:predicted protein [Naegleria gruberi]|uniref:Predicted protein n=1 Tax=Naegleria gruberi TaxID=5762 RepID=D2VX03_NAEGR|nr:uncharacterized protein NAEGRDRAFT_52918 [Naegleria gruberi]EFC38782.1 predicted protein [Naegleria gruberi]|eukprot:XP_002671526.1 predicted protein [Naegleria gruberi strain NEG-M]
MKEPNNTNQNFVDQSKSLTNYERVEYYETNQTKGIGNHMSDPITLNVGGTLFTVSVTTFINNPIEPANEFGKIISGQLSNANQPIFIDCDPKIFKLLYNWLKFKIVGEITSDIKQEFLCTCQMFNFSKLLKQESHNYNPITMKEFIQMMQSTQHKVWLNSYDMRKLKLAKANLTDCTFTNCNFSGMDLRGIVLDRSNLKGSVFSGCNMSNATLKNCCLVECNFEGCDLTRTTLAHSSITRSSFKRAILPNSDLSCCNLSNSNLENIDFDSVDLTKAIIWESNLTNSKLSNCIIKGTHFKKLHVPGFEAVNCQFNQSVFEEMDFNLKAKFQQCTFKRIDFRNSLRDLSPYEGNIFDSCLIDFSLFETREIKDIRFQNIDLSNQNLIRFSFINTFFDQCNWNGCEYDSSSFEHINSKLITDKNLIRNLISLTKSKPTIELLYRATRDGFSAKNFHEKCDNKGPTLSLIKSEHGNIFGGYTSVSWQSPENATYFPDESVFLFKVIDVNGQLELKVLKLQNGKQSNSVLMRDIYSVSYGFPCDLYICNESATGDYSYSNLGGSFELPEGIVEGSQQAGNYLHGGTRNNFKVKEIEVFKINL